MAQDFTQGMPFKPSWQCQGSKRHDVAAASSKKCKCIYVYMNCVKAVFYA